MRRAAAVAIVAALCGCGSAIAAPERWVDPGPKLAEVAAGTPHLVFETEVIVGGGGGYALAYSGDGALLASGGTHGDIVVWDADKMTPLVRWRPYGNAVESLSFSPLGGRLVSGALWAGDDRPGKVYVWNVMRFELRGTETVRVPELELLATFTGGTATAYAPDGSWFVYESGNTLVLVDAKSFSEIRRIDAGPINRLAVSGDSKRIACGGDGHALVFGTDGKLLEDVLLDKGEPVYGVAFTWDGKLVAVSRSGKVRIDGVEATVDWRGRVAVGESSGTVHLLERFGEQARPAELPGPARWIGAIAFAPGFSMELASLPDGAPLTVEREGLVTTYAGNESEVHAVAFSRDGKHMAATGGELVFLDLASGKTRLKEDGPAFIAPGDGSAFVASGLFGTRLMDPATGGFGRSLCAPVDEEEDDARLNGLWASPGAKHVVISRSRDSTLLTDRTETKPFAPLSRVFDAVWSADGRTLFTASLVPRMCGNGPGDPNFATILKFGDDGEVTRRVPINVDVRSLDLAPSGKVLALATAEGVQFRDAKSGELNETLPVSANWWRFLDEDSALVGGETRVSLWRRGAKELVPLVHGVDRGTLSPTRDRVAFVVGGRVIVYRVVK